MTFRALLIYLIFLIGPILVNPTYADEFHRAKQLVKQNKHKQAYEHLLNDEGYHMGEPEYDLLLARVALKAELYHEAIFAFERVLIHQPGNLGARIDMAIAFYRIDELENAQRQLNIVLEADPRGKIRETLNEYVEIITDKIASRRNEFSGRHTFIQGWDSNINSATNESEIELTIGNYRPTEGIDKETSDSYSELINRLKYDYHINVNASLFSQLGYTVRDNNSHNFDNQSANVILGYQHKTPLGKWSVPFSYQSFWLDGIQLRYVSAIGARLKRTGKRAYTDYSVQYGAIRYPDQPALNVNHTVFSYVIGTNDNKSTLNQQYALFYGDESEQNSTYRYNARKYYGMQLRLPLRITARQSLVPRLVYQLAEHKAKHPFFFTTREDRHLGISVAWDWYLSRSWQFTGQLNHSSNDSTVSLYSYQRNVVYGGITYKY